MESSLSNGSIPQTSWRQFIGSAAQTVWQYAEKDVRSFGGAADGVIEMAARAHDGGLAEAGSYFGTETHPHSPVFGISTATGCPMHCAYCDLGDLASGRNLSGEEMVQQLRAILWESMNRGVDCDGGFKVNFAKTGEPLFNPHLPQTIQRLSDVIEGIRFKVSTSFPAARVAQRNFEALAEVASTCPTTIQVQVSLIATAEEYRSRIAGNVASLACIASMASLWRQKHPKRAQFNLSMILSQDTPCDPAHLLPYFDPQHFRIRLRDCVQTQAAKKAGLRPIREERLQGIRKDFEQAGYTVSLAGRPTKTERDNALAANATRNAIRLASE